jgi:glycosyltransferase involved in cell wall biosynthesis
MARKALIIVENLPVPPDFRVWNEARTLQKAGYEVIVLCPRRKDYPKKYEYLENVHVYRHPIVPEGDSALGYLWEYSCALFWEFVYSWMIYVRHRFQVIQGCNPPDNIFLVALPFKLLGVKYIFDHHDVCPELYLSKYDRKGVFYKTQLWLERMTFRCCDVAIVTNNTYRANAVVRGGMNEDDVFVVRNGPDPAVLKALPPSPVRRFGKRFLVGYVGNMSVQEGLDILLAAALEFKRMGRNDVHFTCIGGGPGLAGLRQLCQDKNLTDTVTFTGRIPFSDLLEILSTADVCVNPDRPCEMNSMSTMIKIMEYMALGKPIVQFEGIEGKFSAQGSSLYCNGDGDIARDFAEKIAWLLDHPEERARMGELGRRRVEQQLAWEHSVPHLVAAYERAFNKKGGGKEALETDIARP